jgi:hypothetical protein
LSDKRLEIPESIIILSNDDPIVQEKLVRERQPYLVAGYTIKSYNELPQFSFQATINCNHSQFWLTLTNIIELIPEPIKFSIGDYGNLNEVEGDYSRDKLITTLTNYAESISKDTEVEMLFDHQSESLAFQLYVSDCKFFEIYCSEDAQLKNVMIDCGLPEISNLATVNEFPRIMKGQPCENTQSLLLNIRGHVKTDHLQ